VKRLRWSGVFERPVVYDLAQRVCGVGARRLERIYREVFGGVRGAVLDVGCGPAPDTPAPLGTLVGLDINPRYVARYVRADAGATRACRLSGVVASAAALPFADGAFDECRSAATLHHLPDPLASRALREMYRTLRPGGRLAVFDMVRPPSILASPLGWLVCRLDRGGSVRPEPSLARLAAEACAGAWEIRSFWYGWARLRGCVLTLRKPPLPR
jgi:SAM-dependent methyltransferase